MSSEVSSSDLQEPATGPNREPDKPNFCMESDFFPSLLYTIPPSLWRLSRYFILTEIATFSICYRRRPTVQPALL